MISYYAELYTWDYYLDHRPGTFFSIFFYICLSFMFSVVCVRESLLDHYGHLRSGIFVLGFRVQENMF